MSDNRALFEEKAREANNRHIEKLAAADKFADEVIKLLPQYAKASGYTSVCWRVFLKESQVFCNGSKVADISSALERQAIESALRDMGFTYKPNVECWLLELDGNLL